MLTNEKAEQKEFKSSPKCPFNVSVSLKLFQNKSFLKVVFLKSIISWLEYTHSLSTVEMLFS